MSDTNKISIFTKTVYDYYRVYGRSSLPWRQLNNLNQLDPYVVLISEIMLQQTQVNRVVPKFNSFISAFPCFQDLADAPLAEVLREWSGLGYNRRAKFLHEAVRMIQTDFNGVFPKTIEALVKLPGVGKNTAAAVLVYSFNIPHVFIETNIRSVYLHHFFQDQQSVEDSKLLPIIQSSLDVNNPRIWYWALMDYGSHLKSTVVNPNRRSSHYVKQSAFIGSNRRIRGQVLKALTKQPHTALQLQNIVKDSRLLTVLDDLTKEKLISKQGSLYRLG